MKWSKKDEAKWAKKRMDKSTGHSVNNEEDEAWKRLEKKLKEPELMAVLKRMKNR